VTPAVLKVNEIVDVPIVVPGSIRVPTPPPPPPVAPHPHKEIAAIKTIADAVNTAFHRLCFLPERANKIPMHKMQTSVRSLPGVHHLKNNGRFTGTTKVDEGAVV
jgi:hypothetical protein